MPTQTEAPARLTVYDVPPPDQQLDWQKRVQEFGANVVQVTQFISELSKTITPEKKQRLLYYDGRSTIAAYATGKLAHYKAGEFEINGVPNDDGIADSSCLWTDAEVAAATTHSPEHQEGTNYVFDENIYDDFIVKKYDALPDPDIGLRLVLTQIMTKQQIEKHITHRRQHA